MVTNNVKDFINGPLNIDEIPYEVYSPDDFFMLVWSAAPDVVERTYRFVEKHFRDRDIPYSVADRLHKAGAINFARTVAKLGLGRR